MKLKLTAQTGTFGTDVHLRNRDGTYDEVVAQHLHYNPLTNHKFGIKDGYLFRSPKIRLSDWQDMFQGLANTEDKFTITAELINNKKTDTDVVTAWIRFANRDDAAMFAWTNVDKWQKWSDALEVESQAEAKEDNRAKINIGKDGKITATVKVVTLGK